MNDFLLGVTAMGCVVIALFFLRFWRTSGDRFFLLFALGFATFAVNRAVLATLAVDAEERIGVYVMRLLAFLLIAWAIAEKNRAPASR